jgi:hypothetical protein
MKDTGMLDDLFSRRVRELLDAPPPPVHDEHELERVVAQLCSEYIATPEDVWRAIAYDLDRRLTRSFRRQMVAMETLEQWGKVMNYPGRDVD